MVKIQYEVAICPTCKQEGFPHQILSCQKCPTIGCVRCMHISAAGPALCDFCFQQLPPQDRPFWEVGNKKLDQAKKVNLFFLALMVVGIIIGLIGNNLWENNYGDEEATTLGFTLTGIGLLLCALSGCGIVQYAKKRSSYY